ncbi:MAG: GTPase, partial [Candidatus Thermoplasmatota archaeon]|nr:GTPase [Candidatus Thermoplasmatota archaeon]
YGAGFIAAQKFNSKIIEPRKYAVGSIKKTYEKYGHLEKILPAMGYGEKQISDLEETINNAECDAVVIGTPIDLGKIIKINKPSVRVKYELEERGKPDLEDALKEFLKK